MPILAKTNSLEQWAVGLLAEDFLKETEELRAQIREKISYKQTLPKALALTREAARRQLGERIYDVQVLGAIALYLGNIMEMKTGEGKTISSVAAIYLHALEGKGVHVVTVNDYLAKRDAEWMSPVYEYLGITVGYIQSNMDSAARKEAYRNDVTYSTNNELGFDYLRDNMCYHSKDKTQHGHYYCVIDEIDSILIDEARTPLIISGPAEDNTIKYQYANAAVGKLRAVEESGTALENTEPDGDYTQQAKNKRISFTSQGLKTLEERLNHAKAISGSIFDEENFEYIHYATQALRAQKFYRKDVEYVVQNGKVEIVDEFTGRILHGRRYSEGLHQAIEAKEGIRIARRNRTLATITLQNYFRMYEKIAGMTGTAATEAKEFAKIYALDVITIPTNRPVIRSDAHDRIYINKQEKNSAICNEIHRVHTTGQPILIGTVSIESSEELSAMLRKQGLKHEVLNAKHHEREAHIVAQAGAWKAITIATNMAGRGTDIKLGGTNCTQEEHDLVFQKGGLCIIGTERHEARRIDNQLRGRSGRQGDPGSSIFFLSLDDELMRFFGPRTNSIKQLMSRGMVPGEPLNHPLITKSIERAQRKVEDRNFDIRKHLLEFDDVLNHQREIIYKQRNSIMIAEDLRPRIHSTLKDFITEMLHGYLQSNDVTTLHEALDAIKRELVYTNEISIPSGISPQDTVNYVLEHFTKHLQERELLLGEEKWNILLRIEYLRNIDNLWQAHLEQLDELQEAVYLRSYAQKNPLLEYKLEGFKIFDTLIENIRMATVKRLIAIRIDSEPQEIHRSRTMAHHRSINTLNAQHQRRENIAAATQTLTRSQPKTGRNSPCPCGSGKKYKHCCGKS